MPVKKSTKRTKKVSGASESVATLRKKGLELSKKSTMKNRHPDIPTKKALQADIRRNNETLKKSIEKWKKSKSGGAYKRKLAKHVIRGYAHAEFLKKQKKFF